jgi:hypothetical protein
MEENTFSKEKVDLAPLSHSAYLMRDAAGKIINIGEADNIYLHVFYNHKVLQRSIILPSVDSKERL